jgi:enamine deaminase RidA (YjgF/YER057c/UK114 family)
VEFARATREAYEALRAEAATLGRPWPVRVWNFVPGIHGRSSDGDRYMTFNTGRYQAMRDWFGDDLARLAPAATGVGHDGADLEIHALFASQPGTAVENPQQVPAYQYSGRYGRLPPCFARATRVGDRLFIAGTAAVVGEESRHANRFDDQLDLAAAHLLTVARQGLGPRPRFEHVRVYLPPSAAAEDRQHVARRLCAAIDVGPALAVEFVAADLCRRELLIEIEAVACTEDSPI